MASTRRSSLSRLQIPAPRPLPTRPLPPLPEDVPMVVLGKVTTPESVYIPLNRRSRSTSLPSSPPSPVSLPSPASSAISSAPATTMSVSLATGSDAPTVATIPLIAQYNPPNGTSSTIPHSPAVTTLIEALSTSPPALSASRQSLRRQAQPLQIRAPRQQAPPVETSGSAPPVAAELGVSPTSGPLPDIANPSQLPVVVNVMWSRATGAYHARPPKPTRDICVGMKVVIIDDTEECVSRGRVRDACYDNHLQWSEIQFVVYDDIKREDFTFHVRKNWASRWVWHMLWKFLVLYLSDCERNKSPTAR
ncbi:hypothetical protein NM688_g3641 [Phlebia brevispora]|uniref:Uncharacterized protein n=1 Tax=Phlebia brevispora TaxID=194682 RepID=A0ACC1T547_9APHY|nr:hypothetical protein NM688_g3641 [Phlebia brevispora]